MEWTNKLLSPIAITGWMLLILLPLYGPFMPALEGRLLPVASKLYIVKQTTRNGQTQIYVEFEKLRDCRYLGLNWYRGDKRIPIKFKDIPWDSDPSRPVGDHAAGPWLLDTDSLAGSRVQVAHKCHPIWETHTVILP